MLRSNVSVIGVRDRRLEKKEGEINGSWLAWRDACASHNWGGAMGFLGVWATNRAIKLRNRKAGVVRYMARSNNG